MNSMFGATGYGSTGLSPRSTSTGTTGKYKPFREKTPSGFGAATLQTMTPQQIEHLERLFSHVGPGSYLERLAGGDEEIFKEIEQPALRQFGELLGGLGSRFSGMGMGARKSSGFQNTTSAAAQDFASQLQSQRQGLQRQALQDMMGFSEMLLGQRPFERALVEKPMPFWQKLLLQSMQTTGQAAGAFAGAA